MADATTPEPDWLRLGLMVFFWLLALAALLFGLSLFAYSISQWLDDGGQFLGLDGFFDALIGLIGAGACSAGLLASGVLLRFSRLAAAPRLSLAVSIAGAALVLSSYGLYAGTLSDEASGPKALLLVLASISLVVLSVPPFLHWRSAKVGRGNPPS